MDIRNVLRTNVVISGGTAMIDNFDTRLRNEISEMANRDRLIR